MTLPASSEIRYITQDGRATMDFLAFLQELTAGVDAAVSGVLSDGDKGDVVVGGGGTVWTLDGAIQAYLLNRANHTGTQAATTISDFSEAVDDRVAALLVPGTNITITYNDAANAITIASTAGGGLTGGSATIDFGAAPGTNVATSAITGVPGILAGSRVRAWIAGSTADHNAYEHQTVLPMEVALSTHSIVAGTGFSVTAATDLRLTGQIACQWEYA